MKLKVVPEVERKMEYTLYKDIQMRDDLLKLDKTITECTNELLEIRKQNRKIQN